MVLLRFLNESKENLWYCLPKQGYISYSILLVNIIFLQGFTATLHNQVPKPNWIQGSGNDAPDVYPPHWHFFLRLNDFLIIFPLPIDFSVPFCNLTTSERFIGFLSILFDIKFSLIRIWNKIPASILFTLWSYTQNNPVSLWYVLFQIYDWENQVTTGWAEFGFWNAMLFLFKLWIE